VNDVAQQQQYQQCAGNVSKVDDACRPARVAVQGATSAKGFGAVSAALRASSPLIALSALEVHVAAAV